MSVGARARIPVAAAVALALTLTVTALAGASGDAPTVTADAPVVIDGPGSATAPAGVAIAHVARAGDSGVLTLLLEADELNVTVTTTETGCLPPEDEFVPATPCVPGMPPQSRTTSHPFTLRDARVTAPGPVYPEFQVAWATDAASARVYEDSPDGALEVEHDAGEARLGPADASTAREAARAGAAPSFDAESAFQYDATGAFALDGEGWSRIVLTGLDLQFTGDGDGGERVDERVRSGRTTESDGQGGTITRDVTVTIESPRLDGSLAATSGTASLIGVDEARSGDTLRLKGASGAVTVGDVTYRFDGEDAAVRGALEIVPLTVVPDSGDGSGARLALRVTGEPLAAPAPDSPVIPPALAENAGGAAAAVGAVVAVAGVAWYWPALRFGATALLLPLYTRIERDQVLAHGTRDEIFKMIRTEPGIHAHEIGARAGIGWGTTVYHLRMLEEHRLVVSKRVGRYRRFYSTAGATPGRKAAYAALRNESSLKVAEFVVKNPGTAQRDVCDALGMSPSLVNWHVARLEEAELVKKVRDGRRVHYYAGPAWNDIDLKVAAPGLADASPLVRQAPADVGGDN